MHSRALSLTLLAALTTTAALATTTPAIAEPDDVNTVLDLSFPVAGSDYHFTDTYDASRGGGRLHKSTDIMAPRGTPVHAAVGGTIRWITGLDGDPPSYGYMISIDGDDGLEHGYVHLGTQAGPPSDAYAPGMARGVRVERGELIGFVGNSGCGCVDHLHYDIEDPRYPADDEHYDHFRYNPYPSLLAAEQRGDVPATETAAIAETLGLTAEELMTMGTPLAGDWDGDGTDDLGWFVNGLVVLRAGDGSFETYEYGAKGDVPIVGDFDGDGTDTVSVIRDRTWRINNSQTSGPPDTSFIYGRITRGDVPIAGDWDGDGTDEIGIIRDGEWHLRFSLSGGPGEHVFVYGRIGPRGDDIALIGDWDRNGRDDIGIVRDGQWHLRYSQSGGPGEHVFVYGRVLAGDVPVIGDWDGSRGGDVGIVRDGVWHLRDSLTGGPATSRLNFGGE